MVVGAVADIHGNFGALQDAMTAHPEVPLWICVGDVASRTGEYPVPASPLYWIKGNNEAFDRIAEWQAGRKLVPNLHYIPNGTAARVGTLTVAGLGGTYAPTWYDTPADRLPHTPRDDKRRHFVREEVDRCKRLRDVDILMTHEAPRPFIIGDDGSAAAPRRRWEAGKLPINEVLAALKPRLHLCGHHHRFVETEREGVRSVCIDRINRSYLLIDAGTLAYRKVEAVR
jgi:Icc-related predicted phosphoesterase